MTFLCILRAGEPAYSLLRFADVFAIFEMRSSTSRRLHPWASASENGGAGFAPIGNSSTPFTGAFHGGGHAVRNLTIRPASLYYIAAFATNRGTIDSLGLSNVNVQGYTYVGSLAAYNYRTVSFCYATGSVAGPGGPA